MITAQEARANITKCVQPVSMKIVYELIEEYSKKGKDFVWLVRQRLSENQISELKELGFSVETDDVNDYKISW